MNLKAIWAPDKQAKMVWLKNSFLRSRTVRSQTNFFDFQKSQFPGNLESIWLYLEKCPIFSENPKVTNTARSRTSRRLTLWGVDN